MRKILVLAYQLSPTKGSEYSVAWNYIVNMSQNNELVVLYGVSGEHMGDCIEMKEYIQSHKISNVRFIDIPPNKYANMLNYFNKKGIICYSFYFSFKVWQKIAYKKAVELTKKENFDLIHNVGPIGYREPGYLWKIDIPYVWGPIGGFNNIPFSMMNKLSLMGKLKFEFRNIVNSFQMHYSIRVKHAIKNSDILLTATSQNQRNVKRIFKKESVLLQENAITSSIKLINAQKFSSNIINLIWIGSIDSRKSLIFLLEAFLRLSTKDNLHLHIVGDGILKNKLMNFCEKSKIAGYITWYGVVPRKVVLDLLTNSHLHVITSLSEGNPTTIWEAMSVGVPTLSLDHCGMHDVLCEKCGIKIPVYNTKQVINDLTKQIECIQKNPSRLKDLAFGTIECAKQYTWEKRRILLNRIYDKIITNS